MKEKKLKPQLLQAVKEGKVKLAELLIQNSTKVTIKTADNGPTPLMIAAHLSNPEKMEMLLGNGADAYTTDLKEDFTIHYCTAEGHLKSVELLMSRISFAHNGNKRFATSLMYAGVKGRELCQYREFLAGIW
ncbi:hypothetical protein ACTXT7_013263 [Hymenolepis weldensis]